VSEQVKRVGRTRKWDSEAERKRAYRQRRAAELADPLALREAARAARAEAAESAAAADVARREADRWRARAAVADKRAQQATQRATRAESAARSAHAQRDEARRLLGRKLQWARDAKHLRDDPDALLALIAELNQQVADLRTRLGAVTRQLHRASTQW
jgi:hypothetical protein